MKAWMSSNFGKFAIELRPLINVRIESLLKILKTNRPIKTKFCIHMIIDKVYVGNGNHCFFLKFATELQFRGWSFEPNNQLNVCTTSVTEGEVWPV